MNKDAPAMTGPTQGNSPASLLPAVEAMLNSLSEELRLGGIVGQTQLHARLEDLEAMIQELRRQVPGWNPAARNEGAHLLERGRDRLERISRVIAVMQEWASQRLTYVEADGGYLHATGRGGGGRYRRQPSHGSALEGSLG